ncbi:hypothetical protein X777_12520 [Ooceraea biroi]|uniref:Uncharacterized protein n=1 Tax=Ooceraea biroi TaxID=2015173 RepID=A0A026W2G4_OOCBI|nr:hypothetical protein X777_12520 [Ooceraea biroi]
MEKRQMQRDSTAVIAVERWTDIDYCLWTYLRLPSITIVALKARHLLFDGWQ